jgi:hypothetical protein
MKLNRVLLDLAYNGQKVRKVMAKRKLWHLAEIRDHSLMTSTI